jgi:anti-sigma regulatory factor (Ser/Thr protein kinase)
MDFNREVRVEAERLNWSAAAIPANVREARRLVSCFGERHDAEPGRVRDIALAVSEAVTNVVLHAYPPDRPGAFTLDMSAEGGELLIEVRDFGIRDERGSDRGGLGMGLHMMRTVSDRMEIEHCRPGTLLRLVFML